MHNYPWSEGRGCVWSKRGDKGLFVHEVEEGIMCRVGEGTMCGVRERVVREEEKGEKGCALSEGVTREGRRRWWEERR